ncbi:LuxR C-terminal-related transcriptional regulator [Chloroflexota bacterium]
MDKIGLMVVDKQAFFRGGIRQALSSQSGFELHDCAPSGDLMGLIEANSPDALLLDIDYPSLSGLELAKRIILRYPATRVIILTSNPDDKQLFEVIKTGAVAYLSKDTTAEELVKIVRQAASGQYPINDSLATRPQLAERVLRQFQDMISLGKGMESVTAPLTSRETEILTYIAEGNSNKQIAHILKISEQTIKNHVSAILRKLNANDRAHAVVLAIRHGLISIEERPLSANLPPESSE